MAPNVHSQGERVFPAVQKQHVLSLSRCYLLTDSTRCWGCWKANGWKHPLAGTAVSCVPTRSDDGSRCIRLLFPHARARHSDRNLVWHVLKFDAFQSNSVVVQSENVLIYCVLLCSSLFTIFFSIHIAEYYFLWITSEVCVYVKEIISLFKKNKKIYCDKDGTSWLFHYRIHNCRSPLRIR